MVGIVAVAWWPAFTLGAWHQIFFDDFLALWAVASTAALVYVLIEHRPIGLRLLRALVLLLAAAAVSVIMIPRLLCSYPRGSAPCGCWPAGSIMIVALVAVRALGEWCLRACSGVRMREQ
jgi:hypothetical protein